MTDTGLTIASGRATNGVMDRLTKVLIGSLLVTGSGILAGCVNVAAPDKPIVINLNINITQQVVYRLDGQAKALIQSNPGIF